MATSQELLQALTNMQQTAQSNLPVIPNNGNPRGANNMPGMAESERDNRLPLLNRQPNNGGHFYPWMNPSPSVNLIQQLLAGTGGPNQPRQTPDVNTGGGAPMMGFNDGATVPTANTGGGAPITQVPLPTMHTNGGGLPVLPNNTGIVPPGFGNPPSLDPLGLFNSAPDRGTRNGQALAFGNGQGDVNQNALQFRTVLPRAMQR